jgi:2-amino-4-hydroxy-6-hydroxymethyldihydropteridine diphosphokinase
MATTLIALGANLGDRRSNLQRALALLDRPPELRVIARSRWFSTAPIGGPAGQAEFVNAAARIETTLSPLQLLAVLREVEAELGRQRRQRWAARRVDLDLLLFDDLVLKTPELELPHPRMAFRRFVLEPAADVAADLMHPVIGWTVGQLLDHLNTAPNYVALTGVPGLGKTALALIRSPLASACSTARS